MIVSVHDVMPHQSRLPTWLEVGIHRLLYKVRGDIVVAHSALRDRLVRDFSVSPRRIHVIPLPLEKVDRAAASRGVDATDRPLILFFGTLRENKGIDVLILAAEMLRNADATICVAGRGSARMESALRDAARRLPNLEIELGYISQRRKGELFASATLLVLPYTSFSSQSGVLGEAYSFGVPVVASNVGALGHSVIEDGTGRVIAAGDPTALAKAIRLTIADRSELDRYVQAMDRLLIERSYDAVGKSLRQLYDECRYRQLGASG